MHSYQEKLSSFINQNSILEGTNEIDEDTDSDEDYEEEDHFPRTSMRPFSAPGKHPEVEGTNEVQMSPLLRKLSIRDSQRQRLATPAPHHMALNSTSPTRMLQSNYQPPSSPKNLKASSTPPKPHR